MKKVDAIVFDYDGITADSVAIKPNAFIAMYQPYGECVVTKAREHQERNDRISRLDKIKHYHDQYLSEIVGKEKLTVLVEQLSKLVLEKDTNSKYVECFNEFIPTYHETYDLFLTHWYSRNREEYNCWGKNHSQIF
jgi:hypothetical protein